MDAFDKRKILQTFSIIVDRREHPTERAEKRYLCMEAEYCFGVLDYGDYTYNLALQESLLHDPSKRIKPKCVIERKQNLDELAMCFTRSRDRFKREMERAVANNAKVYLLIENASMDMILSGQYRSKFSPKSFLASITAWSVRYDITPIFCEMDNSGRIIREILYRDAKERLERGEFDE